MNNEAQEAFEKGKQLLESNRASEAVSALAKAVRLSPNNADYRAWLAQAWNTVNNYDEAIRESSRAIELDSDCAKAYRQLGYAQLVKRTYFEALTNFSRAIELEPDVWHVYEWRAEIHDALGNFEDAIVDRARCFQLDSHREPGKWSGERKKFEPWYQYIRQHLMDTVWPRLKSSGERFVEYWPCFMEWGKRSEVHSSSDSVYTMTYFIYGSGYICLTDKNIYLFSLAQISRQFPLHNIVVDVLISGLTHEIGQLEKTDKSWSIPYSTVAGAQITDGAIKLVTAAMTWEIYEQFTGHLTVIMAGINAGLSGKFVHNPNPKSRANTTTKEDVISLLKQLDELKAQGIISEAEFEQKKKELLARL